MKKILLLTMATFSFNLTIAGSPISSKDRDYLETLMRQTWNYLDSHRAQATGFPSDSQALGGSTNTTNIGLYLASIGPACKMGYLSRTDALQRIRKIIYSVKRLRGRRGFLPNWVDIGGQIAEPEGILAVSDFNKLITGLILARQFFPEIDNETVPIIDRVEWDRLYDAQTGNTCWGYDLSNDKPVGPGRFFLASDCRLVVFYMIASGDVPSAIWSQTHQKKIQADGLEFLEPGYHMGGLFMQAIDAIFLNDRTTLMGRSIADMAWHQIRMARQKNLKAWGWSNCNIPGKGYTEGGFLPWWVVTPHASALVIEWYPRHVLTNLRRLESMGLRVPLQDATPWGFRDSVDMKTGLVDNRYLCLDQAMLFLSLVNYTQNELVRKTFARDPLVQNGLKQLASYFEGDAELLKQWARRDACDPEPIVASDNIRKQMLVDLAQANGYSLSTAAWGGGKIETQLLPEGLAIDFDLGEDAKGEAECKIQFPAFDARTLSSIELNCFDASDKNFDGIRLYLFDDQGMSQYSFVHGIGPSAKLFSIDESDLLGIHARPQAVSSLTVKFWAKPWYYQDQRTTTSSGRLVIKSVAIE